MHRLARPIRAFMSVALVPILVVVGSLVFVPPAASAMAATGRATPTDPFPWHQQGVIPTGAVTEGRVDFKTLPPYRGGPITVGPAPTNPPKGDVLHPRAAGVLTVRPSAARKAPRSAAGSTPPFTDLYDFSAQGFTGSTPPDNGLAVGPAQIVEMVNGAVTVYGRTDVSGIVEQSTGSGAFWGVGTILPGGLDQRAFNSTSDPKAIYDPASGRFFASALVGHTDSNGQIAAGQSQAVDIAVSAGSDPRGSWTIFQVDSDNSNLLDQPKLGVSTDKVTVSINVNGRCSSVITACYELLYVLQKSDALAGVSPASVSFTNGHQFNAIPATLLSSSSIQYVVYNVKDLLSNSNLEVMAITGTPAASNVALNQSGMGISHTDSPPNAPQPGSNVQLDTGDDAVQSAAWQNGVLWATGGDGCTAPGSSTDLACVRVDEVAISGTSPSLLQDQDLGLPSTYLFYPAVVIDPAGNLFISVTEASGTQLAAAAALGVPTGNLANVQLLSSTARTGSQPYQNSGTPRWGDYSGAARDPINPADVLLSAEYGPTDGNAADWNTAIGRYTFTAPTLTSIAPTSGPDQTSTCSTNVDLKGTEFGLGSTVSFGSLTVSAAQTQILSTEEMKGVAPPQPAGPVGVVVTTNGQPSNALTFTYVADTTPPTSTATVTPTPNTAGWNKTNPTITLTANDTPCGSGVASITYSATPTSSGTGGQTIPTTTVPGSSASFQITVEGQTTVSYFATDKAGNVEATHRLIVKLDRTAPSATITVSRPPDHNGWYNHPFSATAAGTDSPTGIASGIASCTVTPPSGPGANPYSYSSPVTTGATLTATCTDVAGNTSAPAPINFKYDATPPANVAGSASRPPDFNGWYNHPVTLTYTGTDSTSGIASCTTFNYNGPDAKGIVFAGNCTDNAGNYTIANFGPVNYDHMPPTATVSGGLLQGFSGGAPVTGTAADNVSGVLEIGVAFQPVLGPVISRLATCTSGCGTTAATWSVPTTGIPTGVYVVFALSVDEAGNISPQSNSIVAVIVS